MARSIESFVSGISAQLDRQEQTPGASPRATRRRMRTIASNCGWKARSTPRLEALHAALEEAGIYAFPEVTDPEATMDTFVTFSRTDRAARPLGKIFVREEGIQKFIQKYYVDVFRGHSGLDDLTLVGREVPLYSGRRKLLADLVFRTADGVGVIFEFKRGDPELRAPIQLREYMEAALAKFSNVRGVLVTAKPRTEALEKVIRREIAAQQKDFPIDWYWYSVEVDLQPACMGRCLRALGLAEGVASPYRSTDAGRQVCCSAAKARLRRASGRSTRA